MGLGKEVNGRKRLEAPHTRILGTKLEFGLQKLKNKNFQKKNFENSSFDPEIFIKFYKHQNTCEYIKEYCIKISK